MTNDSLSLGENPVGDDPFAQFGQWLEEAGATEINDPNALALASVDASGLPDVRMVLLKDFDARGFVFYTNFGSAKGRQILGSGKAAMCFHWKSLRRQVRIRGTTEVVSDAEADGYYATRPRRSRLGAWASDQSQPLRDRALLIDKVAAVDAKYPGDDIPRPANWSGFRLVPSEIEFWQDGEFRLHDRILFKRIAEGDAWTLGRLYP
ncbi:pyridoxine/pyridoxamine 5'-phosphate oxidase [Aureimonas sp. SA4125]|uniref:pyridoxamine 5'-phosphate oxidase n=1 Tax=Aureimonas sp. SA4125 TaxID=2826993 RepID=UPI001CC6732C|nr:pyridoxamine 5'-phosphate oxidase [Aureimonas sp. SA4125]BDA83088.1 pyridoxine/pyridoxamine 5'-phosphate oxidase [Aureimonas sp. SA4125]